MHLYRKLLILTFISSVMTMTHAQVDLDSGLNIHYTFNNNDVDIKGTTSVRSTSSFSYGLGVDGINNSSASFDGLNNYIEIEDTRSYNPINNWSISLFIKLDPEQKDITSTGIGIVSKWILDNGDHADKGYPFTLRSINSKSADEGKLFFNISEGFTGPCDETSKIKTDLTYNDGVFHHIVFGKENDMMKLYVDCELVGEVEDETECTTANEANIILGSRNETFSFNKRNRFTGEIDDFRVYDRFLNEEEITFLCTSFECLGDYDETLEVELCDGDEVQVNGEVISESGTYEQILTTENGCDSILNVEVFVNEIFESSEEYLGCTDDGYEVEVNGSIYNQLNSSGVEVLSSVSGCDSIVNVELIFDDCKSDCGTSTQGFGITIIMHEDGSYLIEKDESKDLKKMNSEQVYEMITLLNSKRSPRKANKISKKHLLKILNKLSPGVAVRI